MRSKHFLFLVIALALGGALASGADPSPPPGTEKIDKLIGQLGSAMFMEREAATKALEALGAPALEALKKAAAGSEPEARRRAVELIVRIERRLQTEQLLKPTMVHLVCQDAPVKEAVAQLAKKSGYNVTLSGEPAKYRDRKVTLDTGATTFWQALDRLCEKTGLREADRIEIRDGLIQEAKGRRLVDALADVELTDGKWRDDPVHYAGAARVRCLPPGTELSGQRKDMGEILFGLGVVLEPRVPLERISSIRIDKALDDRGQDLAQVMAAGAAVLPAQQVWLLNGPGLPRAQIGTGPQKVAVRLKTATEPSRSIKELTGCILAEVRTPPEPVMTVDDILQAAGKTAKGKDSGSLTVLEATRLDDGQVRVRVDLQPPSGGNNNGLVLPGMRIMPAPGPVLPVIPPAKQAPGKGLQIQVQQVQVGGARAVGGFTADPMGLSLEDDKGKAFQLINVPSRRFKIANNTVTHEITLMFKPQEKQGEPARLHYTSTRLVNIELPFTLKDVPVP
jgi:hypothetical protein